jgi:hypothetical protein
MYRMLWEATDVYAVARPAVVGIWQKSQGAWVGGPSVAELLPPSGMCT